MKNTIVTLKLIGLSLLINPNAQAEGDIIAIINGVEIPKTRFEMLINSQTDQGQTDTPEFRKNLLEVMVTREILAQEAIKRNLDEDPNFQLQLNATKEQLLLTILFNQIIKESEPSEDVKRSEYSRLKKARSSQQEYLSRHILVDDKETAEQIVKDITLGNDFETLAKDHSIDTSTKDIGGKLDWATPDRFVKNFAEAMVSLSPGEITQTPILSNFGYHIIELLETRQASFPSYDELAEQIRKDLITKTRDDLISDLRDSATIETFE